MSDRNSAMKNLRDRVTEGTEDRLGRALTDLLENPVLTGAIGRAFDARDKAIQAQEVAMGALNIPTAADIERLTRRLRSVSQRLEGIEDGVAQLDEALSRPSLETRLTAIEDQLRTLATILGDATIDSPAKAASNRRQRPTDSTAGPARPPAAGSRRASSAASRPKS